MTEIPTDPVAAARVARDALEAAATHQSLDPDPDHGQFYNHGRELVGVLIALDDLAVTLAGQVARYGDQRLLRDDAGAHPEHRLAAACEQLAELDTALSTATGHANQYWSTIGHLGVAVDPHARQRGPGDASSGEQR